VDALVAIRGLARVADGTEKMEKIMDRLQQIDG
jgi:hypothetical protein